MSRIFFEFSGWHRAALYNNNWLKCFLGTFAVSWEDWWTYDGISGPSFWGLINPDWSLCNEGRKQSPINIEPKNLLYDPTLEKILIGQEKVKQTPEGYISKDIYILSYIQKSPKRNFSILFWSRIFWGYNILFLGISKYHIHILSYILFSTFSARDFGFQRQDFSFSTAVSAISAVICHFLAARLIDQGFNLIR
jgi:hypothetical protein